MIRGVNGNNMKQNLKINAYLESGLNEIEEAWSNSTLTRTYLEKEPSVLKWFN